MAYLFLSICFWIGNSFYFCFLPHFFFSIAGFLNSFYNLSMVVQWTREEDQAIKKFIQDQKQRKRVNWNMLSDTFNQRFPKKRSLKQCRERYEKFLRYDRELDDAPLVSSAWTQKDIEIFINGYRQLGTSWLAISLQIKTKTPNQIKNRFYTAWRRAITVLRQSQKTYMRYTVLTTLLDLSNQLFKWVKDKSLTLNQNSRIFKFRNEAIELCFNRKNFDDKRIQDLAALIKGLNFSLKSFAIFKVLNRKSWKLNQIFLTKLYRIDNFVDQQIYFDKDLKLVSKKEQSASIKADLNRNIVVKKQETQENVEYYDTWRPNLQEPKVGEVKKEIKTQHIDLKLKVQEPFCLPIHCIDPFFYLRNFYPQR